MAVIKLGEALVNAGLIDDFQLQSALGQQRKWGGRIGKALIDLGFIDEGTLIRFLSEKLRFSAVDLSRSKIAAKTFAAVPKRVAEKYMVIPVVVRDTPGKKTLVLAMAEPTDLKAIDEIEFLTNYRIEPVVALESAIVNVLKRYGEEKAPEEEKETGIALEETSSSRMEISRGEVREVVDVQTEHPGGPLQARDPGAEVQGEVEFDFSKPASSLPEQEEEKSAPPPEDDSPLEMAATDESSAETEPADVIEDVDPIEDAETIEDDSLPEYSAQKDDTTEFTVAQTIEDAEKFYKSHHGPKAAAEQSQDTQPPQTQTTQAPEAEPPYYPEAQAETPDQYAEPASYAQEEYAPQAAEQEAYRQPEQVTEPTYAETAAYAETEQGPYAEAEPAAYAEAEPAHYAEDEPAAYAEAEQGPYTEAEPAAYAEAEPAPYAEAEPAAYAEAEQAGYDDAVYDSQAPSYDEPAYENVSEAAPAPDYYSPVAVARPPSPSYSMADAEPIVAAMAAEAAEADAAAKPEYSQAIPADQDAYSPEPVYESAPEEQGWQSAQQVEPVAEEYVASPVDDAQEGSAELEGEVKALRKENESLKQKMSDFLMLFMLKEQKKISMEDFLEEIKKL